MTKKIIALVLGFISSSLYCAEEALARLAIAQGTVEDYPIYQLPVVDQHKDMAGLSKTNCGAHTFRNGAIIADSVQNPDKVEGLQEGLQSVDDIREKFRAGGTWAIVDGHRLSWLDIDQMPALFDKVLERYQVQLATYGYETLAKRSLEQSDEEAREAMRDVIQAAHFPSQLHLLEFQRQYNEQEQFVGVIGIYLQDYRKDILSRLCAAGYETLYDWKTMLFGGDAYRQHVLNRTYGHWITLVVAKNGDHTFFVTTDSSGNMIRIDNEKIQEVVRLLGAENLYQAYEDRYFAQATELAQRLEDRYERSKKLFVAAVLVAVVYWFLKAKAPIDSSPERLPATDAEELLPFAWIRD